MDDVSLKFIKRKSISVICSVSKTKYRSGTSSPTKWKSVQQISSPFTDLSLLLFNPNISSVVRRLCDVPIHNEYISAFLSNDTLVNISIKRELVTSFDKKYKHITKAKENTYFIINLNSYLNYTKQHVFILIDFLHQNTTKQL